MCGGGGQNQCRTTRIGSTIVCQAFGDGSIHAVFRTGLIFEACDDLLQAGDAYSAEEKKHRARAEVRVVLASVPQLLVFASFLRMLFLAPVFCFGLSNVVIVYVHSKK